MKTIEGLRQERRDGVLYLTLDRPERKNPLTFEIYAALRELFRGLGEDRSTKVVVISGAGENFCSGGDVHEIIGPLTTQTPDELSAFTQMTGDVVKAMRACPQPIVAAVDGICAGAGAILAMASDLRYGTARSKVAFLFVRVGLSGADMGACAILPRIVGLGRAAELLYTGRTLPGEEALDWGFYNALCAPKDVLTHAGVVAKTIAQGPTLAHAMTKQMLHREWSMDLDAAIDAEARAQAECMQTGDFCRAYEAFAAKRAPEFEGELMSDTSFLDWPWFEQRHRAFAGEFQKWVAAQPADAHDDADASVRSWVRALGHADFLKYAIPQGVSPIDVRTLCLARETLAYTSALGDFAFAMQGLGCGPISLFADEALKARYLPRVASGEAIAAFALSEREAGSDVGAMATTATRDGDRYVLNGSKTWISNAGIADFYVVFARTGEPGPRGLSAFVVDADASGLVISERIETISPHPLGSLALRNVRVAAGARLGKEGQGFKIAMATLDLFRSTVGAAALGFARRAMDETVMHVTSRQLFGAPLSALQLTQAAIAEMAVDIDASALLVYRAAWVKDSGAQRVTREAAMAKLYATEAAARVADRAVQLFGGRGVTRGEIVERIYRDVRALRIYEGASEVQQVVIARQVLGA